jgi:hypothetical protein
LNVTQPKRGDCLASKSCQTKGHTSKYSLHIHYKLRLILTKVEKNEQNQKKERKYLEEKMKNPTFASLFKEST